MTRLTIVGATGGIGGHLVQQALSAGHDVVAAVRSPEIGSACLSSGWTWPTSTRNAWKPPSKAPTRSCLL